MSVFSSVPTLEVKVDVHLTLLRGVPVQLRGEGSSLDAPLCLILRNKEKNIKIPKSHRYRISVHSELRLFLLAHKNIDANNSSVH